MLNSRAAVRRCAAAIIAQDLLSAKKHSSTRPDLISILGFPAAKLGVSGAVSDRDDLASRRKVVGLSWAAGAKNPYTFVYGFLLFSSSLFTLHLNFYADFWKVTSNSESEKVRCKFVRACLKSEKSFVWQICSGVN